MQLHYYTSIELRRKAENKVLELLGTSNEFISEPREVIFWFYGEEVNIYRLAALLQKQHFEIKSVLSTQEKKDEWLCLAAKVMLVEKASFLKLTEAMNDLAAAYHCRFDGHEMEL